jgi:ribosomal protein S6--L-glutamate ligase
MGPGVSVRIGMLMSRHPASRNGSLMPEVLRLLREWGAAVDLIYPDDRCTALADLRPEHDLYLLKSESELALSVAGALHAAGAPVLNPWPAAAMMKDRITALRRLAGAGVRVPESHVTSSPRRLAHLLEEGPLVLKPHRGSRGHAARVVWEAEELEDAAGGATPILAQRYHRPDGPDHKIYCIGGQLYGVRRRWPARSLLEKCGEPFTITSELRDIALRCGGAFGVELFGIDLLFSGGTPYVVDMHGFPGFKGVPDAALRLADYVYATAHRVLAGEPVAALPRFPTPGAKAVTA